MSRHTNPKENWDPTRVAIVKPLVNRELGSGWRQYLTTDEAILVLDYRDYVNQTGSYKVLLKLHEVGEPSLSEYSKMQGINKQRRDTDQHPRQRRKQRERIERGDAGQGLQVSV